METALVEAIKGTPAAAAVLAVVIIFLKWIHRRDEQFTAVLERRDKEFLGKFGELSNAMRDIHVATYGAIKESAGAIGEASGVIKSMAAEHRKKG